MGRLMDVVQAVSVLVMASAVAWADWVISCCRVSSEAMSYMVRSAKQGEDTKMAITWKLSVWLSSNLDRMLLRGCSTYRCGCRQCHHISVSTVEPSASPYAFWGCILGIRGVRQSFSWLKTWKDTPFCVPSVWYECPSYSSYSPFCTQKNIVYRSLSSLLSTATMIYNEVIHSGVT